MSIRHGVTVRGTSNANERGSAAQRRKRKQWLLDTFGSGLMVQCAHCTELLTWETLTVDRILPGCMGGTYAKGNIRPCCMPCNIRLGNETREKLRELTNWTAPRHKRGCLHCRMVTDYRLARHTAELLREATTGAYRSEVEEYDESNPLPTFKQWLIASRGVNDEPEEVWT
jgi:HNH endonuclease